MPTHTPAQRARQANATELANLLQHSRARTLALAEAYAAALGPAMPVPYAAEFNPPLWELGHIAWFQEFWIARNPQRHAGHEADPDCSRGPSLLPAADALYDSGKVPHAARWHLPLPDLAGTLAYLSAGLNATLASLNDCAHDDAALYFYRLVLFHEDMHAEAAVTMAQARSVPLHRALHTVSAPCPAIALSTAPLAIEACWWQLGVNTNTTSGFVFDNELCAHSVQLPAYDIDVRPVTWRRYLAFENAAALPRYVRKKQRPSHDISDAAQAGQATEWEHCYFGQWQALDLDASACHLTHAQVLAWCAWAGRQLPSEAQWECAAMTEPSFEWGQVWEWTASRFEPFPGFVSHPYRDYSAPWFGSHTVLRGASSATAVRMAHPQYRNFFTPERDDIFAGFRTCALL